MHVVKLGRGSLKEKDQKNGSNLRKKAKPNHEELGFWEYKDLQPLKVILKLARGRSAGKGNRNGC